jgi:hypothetical protein
MKALRRVHDLETRGYAYEVVKHQKLPHVITSQQSYPAASSVLIPLDSTGQTLQSNSFNLQFNICLLNISDISQSQLVFLYSNIDSPSSITMAPPSFPPEDLRQIVQEVATLLKERKETISVAETVSPYPHPQYPILTLLRQQAVSSPQPSSPSPAPQPTTKAA